MTPETTDKPSGTIWGAFIADALAMPVHWYYDRNALVRDYGRITTYKEPHNPHPDSILWRSSYTPLNEQGDILHDQARYWGQRGVHYHQFLKAGENTLNYQLGLTLLDLLTASGNYDANDYLKRYIDFMLTPGRHRDTYVEEYHRDFFSAYARGVKPRKCGKEDIHIGGLAHVPILAACLSHDLLPTLRARVQEHVSLTHRSPSVLSAADTLTRILHAVFNGQPLRNAIQTIATNWFSLRRAEQWSTQPDDAVIGYQLSPACYIDDAFPASLYLAWKYADDFAGGVIANAMVGGDNCHRGAVVGSLLGAAAGYGRLPEHLVDGLRCAPELRSRMQLTPVRSAPSC
ncbi:MAG: hypothetical protein RI897_4272 [Verrucomicrobiota bacterium]|jgi:ADP-ribosylglycohydrolase